MHWQASAKDQPLSGGYLAPLRGIEPRYCTNRQVRRSPTRGVQCSGVATSRPDSNRDRKTLDSGVHRTSTEEGPTFPSQSPRLSTLRMTPWPDSIPADRQEALPPVYPWLAGLHSPVPDLLRVLFSACPSTPHNVIHKILHSGWRRWQCATSHSHGERSLEAITGLPESSALARRDHSLSSLHPFAYTGRLVRQPHSESELHLHQPLYCFLKPIRLHPCYRLRLGFGL
jgi:hypothetical protein